MEKFQSLIGAIIGGILAWIGSYFSLQKQFKNQLEINKIEELNKERSTLLTLKDELEENKRVIQGYVNFMDANDRGYIDFRKDNVNKINDQAWKQVRERVFLSKNITIVKEISDFYKIVYGIQNVDLLQKELAQDIFNNNINLKNKITEHINILETQSQK